MIQILLSAPLCMYKGKEITTTVLSSDHRTFNSNSINQCPCLNHRLHHPPPLPQVIQLKPRLQPQPLSLLKLTTNRTSPTASQSNTFEICYCPCDPSLCPHLLPGRLANSFSPTGSGAVIMAAHHLGVALILSMSTTTLLKSESQIDLNTQIPPCIVVAHI